MSLRHRGERQMNHLVCHGPILVQIRQGCLAPNRNGDMSNWRAKGPAIVNTSALACSNSYGYVRHRISTKIGIDRLGGAVDPPYQIFPPPRPFLATTNPIANPSRTPHLPHFFPTT